MKGLALLLLFAAVPSPGRRLSAYEYMCTVRDLLGVDFQADIDVPEVTPALTAKYLDAAKKISRAATEPTPAPLAPQLERWSNTSASTDITWERKFVWDGDYDLHIAITGTNERVAIYAAVDDGQPERLPVSVNFEGRRYADTRLNLSAGTHRLRVYAEGKAYPEYLEARGPMGLVLPAMPPGYKLVYSCGHAPGQHTAACVRPNLESLTRRAWRRPATAAEMDRLLKLVATAGTPEQQVEMGVEAILVSPAFLFRFENGRDQFAIASRLSYFLWSSMPDEELFHAAERGQLSDAASLEAQARRMLADPKSNALAENFAAQWLEFRNLDFLHRDPARFPEYTDALRDAMRKETELFVERVIHEDRSVLDFLLAKSTFVNEALAKLYGIPGVVGDRFRVADLTGTPRVGVLTQASVLSVTSYATRTSPVLRGKWILENILNSPPPPPPANVPALRDSSTEAGVTLRQQLEQHRSNTACAGCHSRIDPLGFAFENFDAIGRWRATDGALPIDAKGTLPDGETFSSPAELAAMLAKRPEPFVEGLTEKLMSYALGRDLKSADRMIAEEISQAAAKRNYRFSDLIIGIAMHE